MNIENLNEKVLEEKLKELIKNIKKKTKKPSDPKKSAGSANKLHEQNLDNKHHVDNVANDENSKLNVIKCCFSTKSIQRLIEYLIQSPQIKTITFDDCCFFKDGFGFPQSTVYLRDPSTPNRKNTGRHEAKILLNFLGQNLIKTNIENFNLFDPNNKTCADATMVFAESIKTNTKLKNIKYETSTRGTVRFCEIIAQMDNIKSFVNPRLSEEKIQAEVLAESLKQQKYGASIANRMEMRALYLSLQKLLAKKGVDVKRLQDSSLPEHALCSEPRNSNTLLLSLSLKTRNLAEVDAGIGRTAGGQLNTGYSDSMEEHSTENRSTVGIVVEGQLMPGQTVTVEFNARSERSSRSTIGDTV